MENSCVGGDIKSTLNGGNVLLKYKYLPLYQWLNIKLMINYTDLVQYRFSYKF